MNPAYDFLFHLAVPRGDVIKVGFQGASFFLPSDDITIVPTVISGEYEKVEFRIFSRLVRPGMIIADAGANIGLHSVLAARAVTPTGHVFSFEPEVANYALLVRNVEVNGCRNVTCVQSAVGAKAGVLPLYLAGDGRIGTHSLLRLGGNTSAVEVPIVSLNEFFADRRQPDVLKIDVEGYEPEVLNGASRLLAGLEAVFVELNPARFADAAVIEAFERLSAALPYLYRVGEGGPDLVPVSPADLFMSGYGNLVASRAPIEM